MVYLVVLLLHVPGYELARERPATALACSFDSLRRASAGNNDNRGARYVEQPANPWPRSSNRASESRKFGNVGGHARAGHGGQQRRTWGRHIGQRRALVRRQVSLPAPLIHALVHCAPQQASSKDAMPSRMSRTPQDIRLRSGCCSPKRARRAGVSDEFACGQSSIRCVLKTAKTVCLHQKESMCAEKFPVEASGSAKQAQTARSKPAAPVRTLSVVALRSSSST